MERLTQIAGEEVARGRGILAHLGSGASLAAVWDGENMDTSMGFTPIGGPPMATLPGDLDPGAAWYLKQSEPLTPNQFGAKSTQTNEIYGNHRHRETSTSSSAGQTVIAGRI